MKKITKQIIIINAIAIAVFALLLTFDLLSKAWAVETKPNFYLIPKLVRFTITYNSGMAFSMFSDDETAMKIVIAFTVIIMVVIAIAFVKIKSENKFLKILLAVIEAGAIGNLVDRLMWLSGSIPGVRDFIDVSAFGFGICNLADFYVTIGGVVLLVYFLFFGNDPLIKIGKKVKLTNSPKEETEVGVLKNGKPKNSIKKECKEDNNTHNG